MALSAAPSPSPSREVMAHREPSTLPTACSRSLAPSARTLDLQITCASLAPGSWLHHGM